MAVIMCGTLYIGNGAILRRPFTWRLVTIVTILTRPVLHVDTLNNLRNLQLCEGWPEIVLFWLDLLDYKTLFYTYLVVHQCSVQGNPNNFSRHFEPVLWLWTPFGNTLKIICYPSMNISTTCLWSLYWQFALF